MDELYVVPGSGDGFRVAPLRSGSCRPYDVRYP
jgi:hypothetical protein